MRSLFSILVSAATHGTLIVVLGFSHFGERKQFSAIRFHLVADGGSKGGGAVRPTSGVPALASTPAIVKTELPRKGHVKPRRPDGSFRATVSPTTIAGQNIVDSAATRGSGTGGANGQGIQGSGVGRGPRLVRSSVEDRVDYTRDALDAAYQGLLTVDVLISETGRVVQAHLVNPSGFEIDDGVIAAARSALYVPAVNDDGQPMLVAAQLNFSFRIP